MNTPTKLMLSLSIGLAAASAAGAADFDDYARVISVAPQVEQVNEPQRECQTQYEQVERRSSKGAGGAIIGGVVGGLLGNQVGRGTGRAAATAAGVITGAVVGDHVENGSDSTTVSERPVQHCRTVEHWVSRTNGYAVTYQYNGHTYTSVMPYDPGERLKLRVSLVPQM